MPTDASCSLFCLTVFLFQTVFNSMFNLISYTMRTNKDKAIA